MSALEPRTNKVCNACNGLQNRAEIGEAHLTSVSMANGGFQPSGGMILTMPYFLPSGSIFRMYSRGFLNSSSVGLKVGASCKPCGLEAFGGLGSFAALAWPRRSTVCRSSPGDFRALSGIKLLEDCDTPFPMPPILPLGAPDMPFGVPTRIVDMPAAMEDGPVEGGTTMVASKSRWSASGERLQRW
jgi:hypothetical protein